ncbi:MAG: hypothetical protein A2991_00260 [Candidatus Terrybacteria bacterium RIFCSPLOWO2_01_FULL_58_14]|uniref:Uncharacterized protein n=2 Tax=Candidatus Terryibacteriota TaxID=1817920 RepID=A0A1G2PZQ5_9BACT|nr:MAG: hypothetical protein A2682_01475 [Candidatus Terrybacteria bacterium RIFCSPHIGHO2_01_FULL_58_15]OHA53824.1 MAG: hypothetical protein A2991_00260 [Candidatus Terrybacteria bacterium RIFCSPLOWO2_01_FULL_58_14]
MRFIFSKNIGVLFGAVALVALIAFTAPTRPLPARFETNSPSAILPGSAEKERVTITLPDGSAEIVEANTPVPQLRLPDGTVLRNIAAVSTDGNILIAQETQRYQVVYLQKFRRFLISISGSPFETVRAEAEQAFLRRVSEGSREDACARDVQIIAAPFAYPDRQNQTYRLSFC